MSYLVLARKWRPATFHAVVGQQAILKALINGLDSQRLHQAYLFTGSRGIGKTTLARILAKSLNCEAGISSTPCERCANCLAIQQGTFSDLIEVDAASRTKVEDTRELLENVHYLPSQGRFKVYLIDEVHMLSNHSFNALLKTLEEPPSHVKFLFATTDPQKLPATVLSRCLQFYLRRLTPLQIAEHLTVVLQAEKINFEETALLEIATAAEGSMRDALTLVEQAIAHGQGSVLLKDVQRMLGRCDPAMLLALLEKLAARNAVELLQNMSQIFELVADATHLHTELLKLLHQLAVAQLAPLTIPETLPYREALLTLAQILSPEEVQLYYQIAIKGQTNLPFVPDLKSGFEMTLLRMLAFKPVDRVPAELGSPVLPSAAPLKARSQQDSPTAAVPRIVAEAVPSWQPLAELGDALRSPIEKTQPAIEAILPLEEPRAQISQAARPQMTEPAVSLDMATAPKWSELVPRLGLRGVTKVVAEYCTLKEWQGTAVTLILDEAQKPLWNKRHEERLQEVLSQHFNLELRLKIMIGKSQGETPAVHHQRLQQEQKSQALITLENDAGLQRLKEALGAEIIEVLPNTKSHTE